MAAPGIERNYFFVAFGIRPVLRVILGADSENVIGLSASGLVSEISSIL